MPEVLQLQETGKSPVFEVVVGMRKFFTKSVISPSLGVSGTPSAADAQKPPRPLLAAI